MSTLLLLAAQNNTLGDLTPDLDQVAALMRARTIVDEIELGEWTPDTRPTAGEVQTLLDVALETVLIRLPAEVPEELYGMVRTTVALTTCAYVERSYFPDQLQDSNAAYDAFVEDADKNIAVLERVGDTRPEGFTRLY